MFDTGKLFNKPETSFTELDAQTARGRFQHVQAAGERISRSYYKSFGIAPPIIAEQSLNSSNSQPVVETIVSPPELSTQSGEPNSANSSVVANNPTFAEQARLDVAAAAGTDTQHQELENV